MGRRKANETHNIQKIADRMVCSPVRVFHPGGKEFPTPLPKVGMPTASVGTAPEYLEL
jgi:hypothetical protein